MFLPQHIEDTAGNHNLDELLYSAEVIYWQVSKSAKVPFSILDLLGNRLEECSGGIWTSVIIRKKETLLEYFEHNNYNAKYNKKSSKKLNANYN